MCFHLTDLSNSLKFYIIKQKIQVQEVNHIRFLYALLIANNMNCLLSASFPRISTKSFPYKGFKHNTAQKMKFSIKDFFSRYDQIRRKLRIWSHLLKKSLMENFIFCAVYATKKASCIFAKPSNLHLIVFPGSFFLLLLQITEEKKQAT